jgi:3-oxoacyl-[acyl-carrier protein] reductase
MTDRLVQLAADKRARKLITTLGLPVPLPQTLERLAGPFPEQPLRDRDVVVASAPGAQLTDVLAASLPAAGAQPWLLDTPVGPFAASGEAWGRLPRVGVADRPHALVVDATGLSSPADLRALYDLLHPHLRSLGRSGRVLVLGRPPGPDDAPALAATRQALDGFVRSVGREVGRKGSTANLVQVVDGAEDRLDPLLRFVLSPASAYLTGQPLRVDGSVVAAGEVPLRRVLDGRVALVTGAARGIGRSIARRLAEEGAQVVVLDRPADAELASAVAREVGGVYLPCDVTADDSATTVHDFLAERFGHVDIVVHNAGVTRDRTLGRMKPDLWDQVIDVNLAAVIELTDALSPLLADEARIVCLSSIAGIAGNVGQTNYAASKAGVIGYVRALAPTLAARGIAVNAIAPGFIETRLTDAIPVATREVARRLCNLSQGGLPVDIAQVATFLASPGAHGLSGQVVRVCGGNFVGA